MSFGNIVLLIIVAVVGYLIVIYNKFVSLRAGINA
jgi:LemA protein